MALKQPNKIQQPYHYTDKHILTKYTYLNNELEINSKNFYRIIYCFT
jgi:hypothetical protein